MKTVAAEPQGQRSSPPESSFFSPPANEGLTFPATAARPCSTHTLGTPEPSMGTATCSEASLGETATALSPVCTRFTRERLNQ